MVFKISIFLLFSLIRKRKVLFFTSKQNKKKGFRVAFKIRFWNYTFYYVSILPDPPTHLVSKHKHFARPTHPLFCLRNTWMVPNCLQLLGFWNFFVFFRFFLLKLVYFWTKSKKKRYGCFFHSICATDLNFSNKNIGRTKLSTLKTPIFENFWGPEVSGSNLYQKHISAKLTHWHMSSLC